MAGRTESVAENFWFVFFAYFLAITAWTAVSGHDFVSSRWRTVAETRKRGQKHLLVVALPMLYMIVYIYFQAKSGDYKELCATVVAFGFAILHMFRTVLGLWQLHIFKQWVVRSICTMESLGYRIQLPGADSEKKNYQGRSSLEKRDKKRDWAHFGADSIIVNDTIVDNRLSEGDVQCYLRFFTPKEQNDMIHAESILKRIFLMIFYATKSTICLFGLVWPLSFSRSPFYCKSASTPFLEPREPEELWLRWATVLVSCAFPDWASDISRACSSETLNQDSGYEEERNRFAGDVLLSAALHCERDASGRSPDRFLPFPQWRKFLKLRSGTFCKQEFLKYACSTGNGLPFQTPHRQAESGTEENRFYTYAKYSSKLARVRDSLPADEGETLKSFGIEELEWLSIFLSVENWSITSANEGNDQETRKNETPVEGDSSVTAVENLSNQLGFRGNLPSFSNRLSAPFLKEKVRVTLWGNRSVLELSAHVDNWLALVAGEQVSYMVRQIRSLEEGSLLKSAQLLDCVSPTSEEVGTNSRVREESIRLEKQRLLFQLSVVDPEFSYFDQSLTFLGCSMECLRSKMAQWVEINLSEQATRGTFAPTLDSSTKDYKDARTYEFHASTDFELCLLEVSSLSCWSQRYLKMRLLWELQNSLHSRPCPSGLSPSQTEAIMLCILSFPSISVNAKEIDNSSEFFETGESTTDLCSINIHRARKESLPFEKFQITISAAFQPQKMHIEISFSRSNREASIEVTAKLRSEREQSFYWEAWRDAFNGSLEGSYQWQNEHKIVNSPLPVLACNRNIWEGVFSVDVAKYGIGPKMNLWTGWLPSRETLSNYEVMTEGLILQRKKTSSVSAKAGVPRKRRTAVIACPLVEYIPVKYEQATLHALDHASLIARQLIRRAANRDHTILLGHLNESVEARNREEKDMELMFYEICATQNDDIVALGKAITMLTNGHLRRADIERAVELLEKYFTSGTIRKASSQVTSLLSQPFQDEKWVRGVKENYEALMTKTSFDPIVAISCAGFCTALSSQRNDFLNEFGMRALAIATIRSTHSRNIMKMFELTDSLEMLLATDTEEMFSLGCSMYSNKIEYVTDVLNRAGKSSLPNISNCATKRVISSLVSRDYQTDEERPQLCPEVESELRKRKADAQVRLGHLLFFGACGLHANVPRAVELYTQAMEEGKCINATYNLATILENGVSGPNGVPADPSRAISLYTEAMNKGYHAAINNLGRLYYMGKGVESNPRYAADLFSRSIEASGSIIAMRNLGVLLEDGAEGVPADPLRAAQLFSRAVEEGGDVNSMNNLAYLFLGETEGIPRDITYAARLYERAIESGDDVIAMYNLATILESGEDEVPANVPRAVELYRRAIDKGNHTKAMFRLALMYLNGMGVSKDHVRAVELLQRAIDKDGNEGAILTLARVLREGDIGVSADPVRAVELYTRAIDEYGNGEAMYRLGRLLECGAQEVPSDLARAICLYNRSVSETGNDCAARRLREIEQRNSQL